MRKLFLISFKLLAVILGYLGGLWVFVVFCGLAIPYLEYKLYCYEKIY